MGLAHLGLIGLHALQQMDVGDDSLDALVILDHLLVVAAALVGRARLDGQTNEFIDLLKPPVLFR